jgi:haloalkane dehalogenase
MIQFLRTPEERFAQLQDYPFAPHYIDLDGLRMHYLDEGQPTAPVVLMLHGEPSWSYLYRKMIPIVRDAGYRVIAPDLIGFGKSDKPIQQEDYSYASHVNWLSNFLQQLDLVSITLVCQDWGGLLGLRLVAEHPQRFSRVLAANTFLPTGDQKVPAAFEQWRNFALTVPELPVGKIIKMACAQSPSDEAIAAYDAPFPDETYKAGARIFPALVPTTPDDPASPANRAAWEVLRQWTKPFLTAFSDLDPITRGGDLLFQKLIPGTANQQHTTITDAGHFLQEDKGELLAEVLIQFIRDNPED